MRPGYLARQVHLETGVGNVPGDQVLAAGYDSGLEPAEGDTLRVGADQGGRGAVAEQQEAEHLRHVLEVLLQMQARQLQVNYEHS